VTVDANDFLSTDEALLIADRQADGSLPNVNFLKLKSGSDLIDKGMNLGFAYYGSAPDLGAFEYQSATAVEDVSIIQTAFYPNPVHDQLNLRNNSRLVQIFSPEGREVLRVTNQNQLNTSSLKTGIYLIRMLDADGRLSTERLIKN
jgi:hypothetical protein